MVVLPEQVKQMREYEIAQRGLSVKDLCNGVAIAGMRYRARVSLDYIDELSRQNAALRARLEEATPLIEKLADFHRTFKGQPWYDTAPDDRTLFDCLRYSDTRIAAEWLAAQGQEGE